MRARTHTTRHRLQDVLHYLAIPLVVAIVFVSCGTPKNTRPDSPGEAPLTCRNGTPSSLSVRWIDTSAGEDRITNEDWCRSVGGWVVVDHLSPAVPALDSLLIVTWNIYIGGGDLVPFVEDLRAGRWTNGNAPESFVLLLQEVYRESDDIPAKVPAGVTVPKGRDYKPPSGKRMDIVESARRLGLWLFYVPSMLNGEPDQWPIPQDRGNAILSTMPLDSLTAIVLPFEKYRRVALGATIEIERSSGEPARIRIYNVHFDNRARFPRFLQSAGVGRYRQAKALLPHIDGPPAVLGGDFNTWAPSPLETALPLLREVFSQPEELLDKPTAVVPIIPDRRVDYLMFNLPDDMRGTYSRVEKRYGSDHYPLVGWLRLEGSTP